MDLAPVVAMNFMCLKFFLYFSGRAAPRGAKGPAPPQTALFLAAASRRWLLFSWDQQRTRRKVDQFGAMTFFFEISRELEVKQTRPIRRDNLFFGDQQRTWSYVELGVLFLFWFSEISTNLLNFAAPPAKKFAPPRTTL